LIRIQNQRFDVTGSLTGHRQWKKVVSFFMIDCGSGLKRGRLAIGDEQKIGTPDGFYHTPPRRQIARIVGTFTAKGFTQNWNPGRVQCCQTLFELQKIRSVIFAVAEFQLTKIHTHIALIGWVSSSLMGIMYLIAPQISNTERYNRWIAYGNLVFHVSGLLLMSIGFHLIGIHGLTPGHTYGTPQFREVADPFKLFVFFGGNFDNPFRDFFWL
jgi:hypothetical protein